jgi:hypothetical protein
VDGFYEKSLTASVRETLSNIIFVNVDVDLYVSTVQTLEFVQPLLQVGTVLYFDDWKDPRDGRGGGEEWGEHRAWKEFVMKYPVGYRIVSWSPFRQPIMQITRIIDG